MSDVLMLNRRPVNGLRPFAMTNGSHELPAQTVGAPDGTGRQAPPSRPLLMPRTLPTSIVSDVAEHHRLLQPRQRVAGRDELLADVALVADLDERFHDRLVGDLLLVVELAAAGVARGVDVADVVLVLADAADHVAVHDLNVVDVEQELQVRRADPLDDVDAVLGVVPLVAGMP